jgi:hypothetical protein
MEPKPKNKKLQLKLAKEVLNDLRVFIRNNKFKDVSSSINC